MAMTDSFDSATAHLAKKRGSATFIPEPPFEDVFCPVVSVDDHAMEPLSVFEDRVPAAMKDRMPQYSFDEEGVPWWQVDSARFPIIIGNGAAGRVAAEWGATPARYDEFRAGVIDPAARLHDMDMCGIWASQCFGSIPWGFAGSRFARMKDQEAGRAAMRAYNDYVLEEWCAAAPDRYIPCQYAWLPDPEIAAADIHRNAERGFKAVSFSENPHVALGFPDIYDPYWDPFFQACEETETVVNLHVGSSGVAQMPSPSSPSEVWVALFPVSAISAVIDWIYARIPLKYPNIKIALSEGGASWVPMVRERLRRAYRQRDASAVWGPHDPDPVEVMQRNFFFCSIEDPSAMEQIDKIGERNLMIETDYPHQDTTWPTVQSLLREQMAGLAPQTVRRVCYQNACELYRHPLPPAKMLAVSEIGGA